MGFRDVLAGCVGSALIFASSPALADVYWDEAVDGDLSDDRLNPTQGGPLGLGSNLLLASVVMDDLDYLTFTVPAGAELVAINLLAYDSVPGNRAFFAIQQGTIFTLDPNIPDPSVLLGYALFGETDLGGDLLPILGSGAGSIGFTGFLPAGDYTLWIQETSEDLASFTMDLVTIPAPGTAALLAMGMVAVRRRR